MTICGACWVVPLEVVIFASLAIYGLKKITSVSRDWTYLTDLRFFSLALRTLFLYIQQYTLLIKYLSAWKINDIIGT